MFCSSNFYPITFSIPEEKIIKSFPKKKRLLSNLIPGYLKTYIYYTEKDYYEEYQGSYFAMTIKKAGWDCMRHYEILANGCLPYFPGIEDCPLYTMVMLPKHLILKSNKLFEKMKKSIQLNLKEYSELWIEMMTYLQEYLTTKKVSLSILHRSGHKNASKILFLSGCVNPDYLRCLTLHGLKNCIGNKCHDFPKIPHMYTDFKGGKLYGNGYSYSKLLDPSLRNNDYDKTLLEDIKNKKYDIIIYGSYHRGMPLYPYVCEYYPPSKIILLCGEDLHCCDNSIFVTKGHPVFVREI
jgi:hypothetical protein